LARRMATAVAIKRVVMALTQKCLALAWIVAAVSVTRERFTDRDRLPPTPVPDMRGLVRHSRAPGADVWLDVEHER
jgi:hypothetical protein